ncbi:MAG TPA: TIR domain-containing protein [Gemmataceae bacterium]|nr:TIR domain-containing protein [Gemmataceae bacterium]
MPPESNFKFDVFISYSSEDEEWVRGELLKRIEKAELKAFIDYRDFERGAPSIEECMRAVVECRKTLLILTPNYVASGWGAIENIMLQTLDPANRDRRTIPLLKADCQKPLRLAALTHIDFKDGADHDLAWRQLLTSLGKPPEQEAPSEPQREEWFLAHPYPMPANFTGRSNERELLNEWLYKDLTHPLLIVRALGGFGKSALVRHWLTHDVRPDAWPRVVWWSFYENDAGFDNFMVKTLGYLNGGQFASADKEGVKKLLQSLRKPGTLLVLDGFERVLRAFGDLNAAHESDEARDDRNGFDCISPLAKLFLSHIAPQSQIRAKILITTQLRPHVVEAKGGGLLAGTREMEVQQLPAADAVAFFHAQGIRGTPTEIETACVQYGYHPLSLRLLAGDIVADFQQPGDIAAANRFDVNPRLIERQHHVLEAVCVNLIPSQRSLLGLIACSRGRVEYKILKKLNEDKVRFDADLRELISCGLLQFHKKEQQFDLHPIVRRYVYDRLAAHTRASAHSRMRAYFATMPMTDKVTRQEDLAPVIELFHHTCCTGQFDEAFALFRERLYEPLYLQLGTSQLCIDLLRALFPEGEDHAPRLKDISAQAWTLAMLANAYSRNGQPRRAVSLFQLSIDLDQKLPQGESTLALGLTNLASSAQVPIGNLRAAEENLRRAIQLGREIRDELCEADAHRELGRLLAYLGADAESDFEFQNSLAVFEKENETQPHGVVWAYRGLSELLRYRVRPGYRHPAIASFSRALELADQFAHAFYPLASDYVRAHWLLGAAHRVADQTKKADHHLHEALERCRRINLVEFEADILIDLARLRASTGEVDEAQRLAEEALLITERSGYVLQGADAHLELAKLARGRKDKATALVHAQQAITLATCDGPPHYTYKAAYVEAEALLKKLG